MSLSRLFVACLLCSALVIFAGIAVTIMLTWHDVYSAQPHGAIASEYDDVPNVAGMRADHAAALVADTDLCPEFEACVSGAAAGTVLEVGSPHELEGLAGDMSSLSWGDGCTAGYNERGNWNAYVKLVVAVS